MKLEIIVKKVKEYFMSIIGVATIILGIIAFTYGDDVYYNGYGVTSKQYGGEAYTGIQNAAAQTANNIKSLGQMHKKCYSDFMNFIGLTMVTSGVLLISYNIISKKVNKAQTIKRRSLNEKSN